MSEQWRKAARMFFDERAGAYTGNITLAELSYISGRDARLWADALMYEDLITSVLQQLGATEGTDLLEVGSASGFLAWGLAPRLAKYVGVDVAGDAVRLANQLKILNAEFRVADGENLPFQNSSFDAVVCYDVFTNFPNLEVGEKIIAEMIRVSRPGGRILVGSIPDAACKKAFEKKVGEVSSELDGRCGPAVKGKNRQLSLYSRLKRALTKVTPEISCYYFRRQDFIEIGARLGVVTDICDIHSRNPYHGLRFNALYSKPKG
jgi:ubiquinone/menaquinone biosynthesis C-methylase UbiE